MTRPTAPGARALAVISTLVVVVLLLASAVSAGDAGSPKETYQVRPGDSLWTIAEAIAGPDEDVRDVVDSIRGSNDITGSLIHPGDVLVVPAAERRGEA